MRFLSDWPHRSVQGLAWVSRRHCLTTAASQGVATLGARGLVCGAMTALGGIGHTPPFLIPRFHAIMTIAFLVVLVELAVITGIRHRYMETPIMSAATQVALGGALVFGTGVLIGSS